MRLALFPLALAAFAQPQAARLENMQELFTANDYPVEALRKDEQGTVAVKVDVDSTGKVSACTVEESSGSPSLDRKTCEILEQRAHFEPAKDKRGQPVPDTYHRRVTWRLQGEPAKPAPRSPWRMWVTVAFSDMGEFVSCKSGSAGAEIDDRGCSAIETLIPQTVAKAPDATPAELRTMEVRFSPGEPGNAPSAPIPPDAFLVSQQISRVAIEPDGTVSGCEGISYSGESSPAADDCAMVMRQAFAADPDSGTLIGTIVNSRYIEEAREQAPAKK